ncbi:hypothetical protein SEA_FUZZBUSTER_12 [Microbacterium phage FuzzBuster]|uniref:DUF1360 domain-containing protein n=1 Tax=Microbacterium phage FuzzBuster TaxID=2590935 RepID=A0A516KUY9_9CAUD|nr:hypothetical protein SEA_FUZZBUSTER_12 [Microbacterium phage FuzzBuster]
MAVGRIILTALAALRATRFVTSDSLGEWVIVGRAKAWAYRHEAKGQTIDGHAFTAVQVAQMAEASARLGETVPTPPASWGWRSKLVSGLDCPFCVGFWLGAAALLAELVTRRVPVLRGLWSFAAGALALNYVTGHISKRIDG